MTKIKNILELLALDDYYGVSQTIDEAKGINKLPESWKELKSIVKRKALNKKTQWHKQK
jgi:hypothetical protein